MCLDSVRGWSATSSGPWGPPRRRSGVPGPPLSGGGRTSRSGFSVGSQRRERGQDTVTAQGPSQPAAQGRPGSRETDRAVHRFKERTRALLCSRFCGNGVQMEKACFLNGQHQTMWTLVLGTSRCSGLQPLGPPHRPWPRPPLSLGRGVLCSPLPA